MAFRGGHSPAALLHHHIFLTQPLRQVLDQGGVYLAPGAHPLFTVLKVEHHLRLPAREDPRLRKVRLALSFFPGTQEVKLYFEDCKKLLGSRCEIHPALVQELTERLGQENVVVQ